MALMDFVKRQFVDVIEWVDSSEGVLAWRFPIQDREIRHGARLVVREAQMALLANEGLAADLFGPGVHDLTARTLPVLGMRKNWDARFASPFRCDVYFFNTRAQPGLPWRADPARQGPGGSYRLRLIDPRMFHAEVLGRHDRFTLDDLEARARGVMHPHIAEALGHGGGGPDLAPEVRQLAVAGALQARASRAFEALGLRLLEVSVHDLPAVPAPAWVNVSPASTRVPGPEVGADGLDQGLPVGEFNGEKNGAGDAGVQAGVMPLRPDEVIATLEKLAGLKARGILTEAEFDAKKTELLRKLV